MLHGMWSRTVLPSAGNGLPNFMQKRAYGIETVELRFNESEIISAFADIGFRLLQSMVYLSDQQRDCFEATYVFEKCSTESGLKAPAPTQTKVFGSTGRCTGAPVSSIRFAGSETASESSPAKIEQARAVV